MSMQVKTGLNAITYINTGTYGVPVWANVNIIKEVQQSGAIAEGDTSLRASSFKLQNPTQLGFSFDITFLWQTKDANYLLLRAAALAGTNIDMVVMDTAIATSGAEGLRAFYGIFAWDRSEPIDGVLVGKCTIKPALDTSGNFPTWMITA